MHGEHVNTLIPDGTGKARIWDINNLPDGNRNTVKGVNAMGVSTNGILFYGFIEEEEAQWVEYNEDSEYNDEEGEPMLDILFREKFKDSNLVLEKHCSLGYPLLYLAIASTENVARRGFPAEIDPAIMVIQPEWEQQLRDCAKELGLNVGDKKPGWYLASWWDQ